MKSLLKNKRILCRVISLVIFLGLLGMQHTFPQAVTLGDVNNDGRIDIIDALNVARYYVGLTANINTAAADVNNSGSIDIIDALLIAQYYVGLITVFPGQSTTPGPTPRPTGSSSDYTFSGILNNGLINGAPVSYTTTASFNGSTVTITFDGGPGFEWIWCYTPGYNKMTSPGGYVWATSLSSYAAGSTLEYYFTVCKDDQEANNNDARHTWVIGSSSTATPQPTGNPAPDPTVPPTAGDYTLVWADEFNGSGQPDSANWNYNVGNGYNAGSGTFDGWGNGEWEWYRPQNAYQEGGNLVIRAEYNSSPASIAGRDWYQFSARLTTQGKRSWQYGRIEARIAMPNAAGTWPAFWMLGTSCDASYTSQYNPVSSYYDSMATNWASCGELDIMEHRNSENTVTHNLFWDTRTGEYAWQDGSIASHVTENINVGNVSQFHLYTLEWDANELRWYVDRETNPNPTKRMSITDGNQEEFHKPFFLMLNLAIQGRFTGPTDPNQADFPLYMYVDYVRVWQQ